MIPASECKTAIIAIHKAINARPGHILQMRFSGVEQIRSRFVFVGGGLVPLFITDPGAPPVGPTKDVDVVFEVSSSEELSRLRITLLQAGFKDDSSKNKPACELQYGKWIVDVLTTSPIDMGGSNRWFSHAVKFAEPMTLDGLEVLCASAPVFVATKLEAWISRGRSERGVLDYKTKDIEDIVAVIDGRPEIDQEWATAPPDVLQFVALMFRSFLNDDGFLNTLPGHVENDDRAGLFLRRVESHLLSLL